jgi:transcriptional regulator GlxA family with amidase domain
MARKNLAILLFSDVEVLDFAGPFEVFSVTDELNSQKLLNVFTVAKTNQAITAKNGLKVVPDFDLTSHPAPNFLLIPGGVGTRALLDDKGIIEWIRKTADRCERVLSVCSGALLLAQSGLLDNLRATTHHQVLEELEKLATNTEIIKNERFVDNGKILTAAGISAGIDMSLYFVEQLFGVLVALKTANYMEYLYLPSQTVTEN